MKTIAGEIDRLKQHMSNNPKSMQFARLAEYLIQVNRVPEAIDVCNRGLEHHSGYANAHSVLGQCFFINRDFDSAESEFNKTLLHDPQHLRAHYFQANIMKERGWNNAYSLWLKRILAIDPLDQLAQSMLEQAAEEVFDGSVEEEAEATVDSTVVLEEEILAEETIPEYDKTASEETFEEDFAVEEETSFTETDIADEENPEETEGTETKADEKKYEFILDDIFQDEVAPGTEEASERTTEDLESYEQPESIVEEEEDVTEEIIEEKLEDEEEIVSQIRDRVEQFEEESEQEIATTPEDESEERVTEVESLQDIFADETKEEQTEPRTETEEDIFPENQPEIKPDVELTGEEEIVDLKESIASEEPPELETKDKLETGSTGDFESLLQETDIEDQPEIEKREKAVREVFGDEETTEPSVTTETEAEKTVLAAEAKAEPTPEITPPQEPEAEKVPAPPEEKTAEETPSGQAKEPIVTSTLGEIYAAQGHFAKAIGVYEVLLKKNPGNEFYKEKIESLKRKQEEAERPDFEE